MSTNTESFLHPTVDSFQADVLDSDQPVLVDFWASWCGPCLGFKPVVEAVSRERGLNTAFVNVDEAPELAQRYEIRSIPALKLFRGGELVAEATGGMGKQQLEAWLEQHGA